MEKNGEENNYELHSRNLIYYSSSMNGMEWRQKLRCQETDILLCAQRERITETETG